MNGFSLTNAFGALLAAALATSCLALVDFKETCHADSDCGSGLFCNDGSCTDTCNEYSNCGQDKTCSPTTSKCVAIPTCNASNEAQMCGKYACNTSTAHCYADCRGPNLTKATWQCGASTVCTPDYSCRYPCTDTFDPLCSPYLCDTIMEYCSNYCIESVDCASGYTCSSDDTCTR